MIILVANSIFMYCIYSTILAGNKLTPELLKGVQNLSKIGMFVEFLALVAGRT
jgi:hypothetical protein